MRDRPKVLVLSMAYPSEARSGFATFIHEQTAALRDQGAEVQVFQPLPRTPFPIGLLSRRYREISRTPRHEAYRGIELWHASYLCPPRNWWFERVGDWMIEGIRDAVLELHRSWPFDVINAHTTYPCGYCANEIRDSHLPRVRVVHTVHRASVVDTPRINAACAEKVRRSLQGADGTAFDSREGMKLAVELTGGALRREPAYNTNGVNPEQFAVGPDDAAEVQRLRDRYGDATNLLFVGALCERKGTWELLEAFAELTRAESTPLRLLLVGPNLLGRSLDRRLRALGIEDRVVKVGRVAHDQVKVWMAVGDAFVLPSHSEGVATVLFEALYAGLPSVLTRVGGTEDVVRDGETALLVPPRSVPSLVAALQRLLRDDALRERLSQNGRRLVREEYTWSLNARRILEVIESVL